jgi:hypothetical protein
MKYVYPKKTSISEITVIELKDKFIIKINNRVNLYGIILKLEDFEIIKEYNNYKIVTQNKELDEYEEYLFNKIDNYKKIKLENEIKMINGKKIKDYFDNKPKELYLNIHYVKKTGFLNIPKISIL